MEKVICSQQDKQKKLYKANFNISWLIKEIINFSYLFCVLREWGCHTLRLFSYIFILKIISMEQVLNQLENKTSWKESLRKTCRINKFNTQIISAYTPLRFRASYTRFRAIYQRRCTDKAERWLQNQLKAFYWFVIALSCISQKKVQEFTQKQWNLIYEVFSFKQPRTLEYEGKKLIEESNIKQSWEVQEEKILIQLVQQSSDNGNKWNEYARKLYEISDRKYFKTGKQCRERWLNHLDPNKIHGQWMPEQDINVAKLFITEGKKWSLVSKKLGGSRTQHMVKNRFKTLVSRQKKLYPQINNEFHLLKTFLDPQLAEKYIRRQNGETSKKRQECLIKTEQRSCEEINRIEHESRNENENNNASIDQFIREDGVENKNIPQTSSAFQMPQVFSPWYMITPTFSPYYVNMPNFSAFEASFINNQFYCPKSNDKVEQG